MVDVQVGLWLVSEAARAVEDQHSTDRAQPLDVAATANVTARWRTKSKALDSQLYRATLSGAASWKSNHSKYRVRDQLLIALLDDPSLPFTLSSNIQVECYRQTANV